MQGTDGLSTQPNTSPSRPQLRRSSMSIVVNFQTAWYAAVFLAHVKDFADESLFSQLAYMAKLQTDW
jgi:hypothetical protein